MSDDMVIALLGFAVFALTTISEFQPLVVAAPLAASLCKLGAALIGGFASVVGGRRVVATRAERKANEALQLPKREI